MYCDYSFVSLIADLQLGRKMAVKRKRSSDSTSTESFGKKSKEQISLSTHLPKEVSKPSISPETSIGTLETLPQLPTIQDRTLEETAFTHQGTLTAEYSRDVSKSYERLEFLGDAYLELIATRVVFSRFPNLTAGQLSQKRQSLVKNETLASFSLAYGFDKRARLPKDVYSTNSRESKKWWIKTMGDIFEAYVAAVVISDTEGGLSAIEAWMAKLWAPNLSNRDDANLNMNAKSQLAGKIMGKGIKISYREEGKPVVFKKEGKVLFQIGAYLTGWGWDDVHLGSGKGWNKNEAGSYAAAEALSNPLTEKITEVKRSFDLKKAHEKAEDGEGSSSNRFNAR